METELQNRGPEEVVVELKRTLKKWEKSFISEHGRTPSRVSSSKASYYDCFAGPCILNAKKHHGYHLVSKQITVVVN